MTISLQEIVDQRQHAERALSTLRGNASDEAKATAVQKFWQTNTVVMVPAPTRRGLTVVEAISLIAAIPRSLALCWIFAGRQSPRLTLRNSSRRPSSRSKTSGRRRSRCCSGLGCALTVATKPF